MDSWEQNTNIRAPCYRLQEAPGCYGIWLDKEPSHGHELLKILCVCFLIIISQSSPSHHWFVNPGSQDESPKRLEFNFIEPFFHLPHVPGIWVKPSSIHIGIHISVSVVCIFCNLLLKKFFVCDLFCSRLINIPWCCPFYMIHFQEYQF